MQLLTEGTLLALHRRRGRSAARLLGAGRCCGRSGRRSSQADAIDLHPDLRVLLFTLGVSLATGVALRSRAGDSGVAPRSRRRAEGEERARRPDRTASSACATCWSSAQVALSLVALVGAGLFLRSLQNAQRISPGFDADHLAVALVRSRRAGLHRGARPAVPAAPCSSVPAAIPGVQARVARQHRAAVQRRLRAHRVSRRAGHVGSPRRPLVQISVVAPRRTSRRSASR